MTERSELVRHLPREGEVGRGRVYNQRLSPPEAAMARPKNDNFLRALLREPVDYTPTWLMRQAGRYLPEYNETRRRAGNFLNLCKNPGLACEVTLQPLARFPLDAAILFSDILTVPDAMGLGLYFAEGEGPKFERPLREEWAIRDLAAPDPDAHLRYVLDAVREIRRALDNSVPLIGFSGSPFTLACYMVEGGGSDDFRTVKTMLYDRPDLLHRILEVNAQAVTDYLNAQIEAGAQAVQIFDTWGGMLSHAAYREFSLAYMQRVIEGLIKSHDDERVPCIVFTKGGGQWLEAIAATGCDAIGVDWTTDLGEARRRVGDKVALQGNLDPMALFASNEAVAGEARRVLDNFGPADGKGGHVFNLGHGISQYTAPERVSVLVETVRQHSRHS
ncbi:uroporphyrinogen decarboxylase [Sulfurisoma sediminicola]|uniref:Uroporphyrinogen decarboxylase n=2 Tax=Sulfurisoma sediminicola TaxID=1381557 RepID=A0A497XJW4_9PROT|nr:uroporphyrinogen decarboxylase [Sulfurisoma sediminicola]